MIIRKEALKSKESPRPSEKTFNFPSMYSGFELHFHLFFFLLELWKIVSSLQTGFLRIKYILYDKQ